MVIDRVNTFLSVARPARRLPNFRGKVRLLKALYRVLGLEGEQVAVETSLHRPITYRARLDLGSAHERMAFLMDGYEWDTTLFLSRLHTEGGQFLDVGANVGLIALPFAAMSRTTKGSRHPPESDPFIYCLEPVRSNYEALLANIALNPFARRVRALCAAVGEREGEGEIQIEGDLREGEGTGTANILAADSTHECERVPVAVRTIDALINAGDLPESLSLIKLDTDGYDLFALRGATKLMTSRRPIVFGEFMAHCLAWHGQGIEDVASLASKLDYRLFVRRHPRWLFAPLSSPGDFEQDLLLVPDEALALVEWCLV